MTNGGNVRFELLGNSWIQFLVYENLRNSDKLRGNHDKNLKTAENVENPPNFPKIRQGQF